MMMFRLFPLARVLSLVPLQECVLDEFSRDCIRGRLFEVIAQYRVNVKLPTVEVKYNKNLHVEAECEAVQGKALPTLWNSFSSLFSGIMKTISCNSQGANVSILNDVSGIKSHRVSLFILNEFSQIFKTSYWGRMLDDELSQPYDKSQFHINFVSFSKYSLGKWELFKACMKREILLTKRNSFIYVFKTVQLTITAIITMTVFLLTQLAVDLI